MEKTAIILGATGLTGNAVLNQLLVDNRYKCIKLFVRKPIEFDHPKIKVVVCDVLDLEEVQSEFMADEVYVCIGTTAKKTPNKSQYRDIDYGIPVQAAKLCRRNKIPTIAIMSSIGADAKSNVFYTMLKGEMEQKVISLDIPNTIIVRPSMIFGPRKETRIGESIGKVLFRLVEPLMIGKLRKYRGIHCDQIAKAMIYYANQSSNEAIIYESNELAAI